MLRRGAVVAFLLLLPLAGGLTFAQDGVDAGSFARFGVGARALGMGGAFAALVDDMTAPFWNPAGLALAAGFQLGGMYTNKFGQDIQYQYLGGIGAWEWGGLGGAMVRQAIEDIPFYGNGEGEYFSEYQTLWLASGAVRIPSEQEGLEALSVGATLKYYTHELLEGRGTGLGFDLGLMGRVGFDWGTLAFGLVSRDIRGTQIKWKGTDHEPVNAVPWINAVGLSLGLWEGGLWLSAGADLALGRPGLTKLRLGAELWLVEGIALRAGLVRLADGTLRYSAGAGFRLGDFVIDYAFVPHPVLGDSHILSAEFRWALEEKGQAD